jgi:hypothetical protein
MEEIDVVKEVELIKERNKRVELDKAWEVSLIRKVCIAILTYFVVVLYSYIISKFSNIWLSSLVPVMGFLLSTLSIKFVRKVWGNCRKRKSK